MDALTRLVAIEDIRQLKARYFRCVDTKQWAEWREVFTPDAVMLVDYFAASGAGEAGRTAVVEGADAIVAFASENLAALTTVHHGPQAEITIESPTAARAIWAMRDILVGDGVIRGGCGHYHERYRCDGGVWRIERTHVTRLAMHADLAD